MEDRSVLADLTISEFLEKTAAGTAAPGGGSVAALCGSLGAGLVEMAARLTIGKKGYEAVEAEMQTLAAEAADLRAKLAAAIDRDCAAYTEVMAAYRKPRDTDKAREERTAAIQQGLKNASLVPLQVAADALRVMQLAATAIDRGNVNAVTDAAVAVLAAGAALRGAVFNVRINLAQIRDAAFVKEMRQKAGDLQTRGEQLKNELLARAAV